MPFGGGGEDGVEDAGGVLPPEAGGEGAAPPEGGDGVPEGGDGVVAEAETVTASFMP